MGWSVFLEVIWEGLWFLKKGCTLSLSARSRLFSKALIPSGSFPWDFVSALLSVLGLQLVFTGASRSEAGDRTAFLCVNTTAQRVRSRMKTSGLLRRQNQVINLSNWVWWLLWG